MSNVDTAAPEQLPELAGRDGARKIGKMKRETIMIPFKKLMIRDDFNLRIVYKGIEDLANMIAANGLEPLVVDITKNLNHAIIEKGHRRFKALQLLWDQKRLQDLEIEGISDGMVECFKNLTNKTELQRLKGQLTSNAGEPYTYEEKQRVVIRMKNAYGLSNENIANEIGMSRQTVDNMLLLASAIPELKKAVESEIIKPSVAVKLMRLALDDNDLKAYISEHEGSVITTTMIDSAFQKPSNKSEVPPPPPDTANRKGTKSEEAQLEEDMAAIAKKDTDWKSLVQDGVINMDNPDKIDTLEEDKANFVNTLKSVTNKAVILPEDDTAEMKSHQTSTKINSQPPATGEKETVNQIKDETTWCTDIIKNMDKLYTIVQNLKIDEGTRKDMFNLIHHNINKLESIKEFTVKAEIRN